MARILEIISLALLIGILDGTHVRIDKPAENPDSYLNRKYFFSIQVSLIKIIKTKDVQNCLSLSTILTFYRK